MVTMCSTTWAGVLPDISARPLEVYPYKYHMQGISLHSSYVYPDKLADFCKTVTEAIVTCP